MDKGQKIQALIKALVAGEVDATLEVCKGRRIFGHNLRREQPDTLIQRIDTRSFQAYAKVTVNVDYTYSERQLRLAKNAERAEIKAKAVFGPAK